MSALLSRRTVLGMAGGTAVMPLGRPARALLASPPLHQQLLGCLPDPAGAAALGAALLETQPLQAASITQWLHGLALRGCHNSSSLRQHLHQQIRQDYRDGRFQASPSGWLISDTERCLAVWANLHQAGV